MSVLCLTLPVERNSPWRRGANNEKLLLLSHETDYLRTARWTWVSPKDQRRLHVNYHRVTLCRLTRMDSLNQDAIWKRVSARQRRYKWNQATACELIQHLRFSDYVISRYFWFWIQFADDFQGMWILGAKLKFNYLLLKIIDISTFYFTANF